MRPTIQCEFELQHWIKVLLKLIWIDNGPMIRCEHENILQYQINVLIKVI
jgi:hypothetical protein